MLEPQHAATCSAMETTTELHTWCFVLCLCLLTLCKPSSSSPDYCSTSKASKPISQKRLVNYNFLNETTSPYMNCTDHCALSCFCVSLNKKKLSNGEELCELNFEDEDTSISPLQTTNHYEHIELEMNHTSFKVRHDSYKL